MTNSIQEVLNSLGINEVTLEKLQLDSKSLLNIDELRDLVLKEMKRKNLGFTYDAYNLINVINSHSERLNIWIHLSSKLKNAHKKPQFSTSLQILGYTEMTILKLEADLKNSKYFEDLIILMQQGTTYDQLLESNKSNILILTYLISLSEIWICQLYEFVRSLKQALKTAENAFSPLNMVFKMLEIVRMPLAKYELKGNHDSNYEVKIAFLQELGVGWKIENTVYTRKTIADLFLKDVNNLNFNILAADAL